MFGDDTLEKLQFGLRQVAGRREVAERLRHGWKGVAPSAIVIDHAEGLKTSEHAILHDLSSQVAAAQCVVGGREVLLRPEAISAEHECPVHVEQDNREPREHAGGIAQSVIKESGMGAGACCLTDRA